jgi:tetratricopeptide (TPR) repeat protein
MTANSSPESAATALLEQGLAAEQADAAIAVVDRLLEQFGGFGELPVRAVVAKALSLKAGALMHLGRAEEELAVYNELVRRCVDAKEPALRQYAAQALHSMGALFSEQQRHEQANAAFDDLLACFADAPPEIIARSRLGKGNALAALGRSAEASAAYDAVVEFCRATTSGTYATFNQESTWTLRKLAKEAQAQKEKLPER